MQPHQIRGIRWKRRAATSSDYINHAHVVIGVLTEVYQLIDGGYDVLLAASGEEALGILETEYPHIVTLDLVLPAMSGLETLKHIRVARPDLPVIMISGNGRADNIVQAMRLGASDFLGKPFELDELERAFHKALDSQGISTPDA